MMQMNIYFLFVDNQGAWNEDGNFGSFDDATPFISREQALSVIQNIALNLKEKEKVHLVTFEALVMNAFHTPMYQSTPKGAVSLHEEGSSVH